MTLDTELVEAFIQHAGGIRAVGGVAILTIILRRLVRCSILPIFRNFRVTSQAQIRFLGLQHPLYF